MTKSEYEFLVDDNSQLISVRSLPMVAMDERHYGLTKPIAAAFLEAARVCLDRHHLSPQEFLIIDDNSEQTIRVEWEMTDDRTRGAWANEIDTTEMGAYCCSLAASEISRGFVAVRRAETRTGADYYVAPAGSGIDDLEQCYRIEVSGTDQESAVLVKTRLKTKVAQAKDGNSNLPAMAAVVGYRARLIMLQTVE